MHQPNPKLEAIFDHLELSAHELLHAAKRALEVQDTEALCAIDEAILEVYSNMLSKFPGRFYL